MTRDLQEEFIPRKGTIYFLSRIEREEVQVFVDSQLKKGYIQPSIITPGYIEELDNEERLIGERYSNYEVTEEECDEMREICDPYEGL